jgi:arylsulfatase A-like enzyme
LTGYQIDIPFMIKVPQGSPGAEGVKLASSIDLFPTIIDAIGGFDLIEGYCDGVSILRVQPKVTLSAAANGERDPNEFCLDNGKFKAFFRFESGDGPMRFRRDVWLEKVISLDESEANYSAQDSITLIRNDFEPFTGALIRFE